jgi:hypothetical protein
MVATSATPNRIAPYLSEPARTLPPLPADPAARSALLSDAVFAAVLALQGQLTHHDPAVVRKAAEMILDFEKTRLRHGRAVAGTIPPSPLEPLPQLDPLPQSHPPAPSPMRREGERSVNRADPFEGYVDQVRQALQSWEEEDESGITVSSEHAREFAVGLIDRERMRRAGVAVPPPAADARFHPPASLIDSDIPRRE